MDECRLSETPWKRATHHRLDFIQGSFEMLYANYGDVDTYVSTTETLYPLGLGLGLGLTSPSIRRLQISANQRRLLKR
jgi:hypothetical protein